MGINSLVFNLLKEQNKFEHFDVKVGDKVDCHIKITDEKRERMQIFSGTVIRIRGHHGNKTITVLKVTNDGIAIRRTMFFNSPSLVDIKVLQRNIVRRSRIYYFENLRGKKARLKPIYNKKTK